MANKLEVSFNSPQCGWMSIGFDDGLSEFHTTTAYTPHSRALSEILRGLSALLTAETPKDEFVVEWSRNPEAYNLYFKRDADRVNFKVIEYPSFNRLETEGETVFSYSGNVKEFCQSFYETFQRLYEDRDTDEFEFHWRQAFPLAEYEIFESNLKSARA
ncbi:MAG TPA: hypothetical protein VF604_16790 [Pyrinomonadaceae bacterium]